MTESKILNQRVRMYEVGPDRAGQRLDNLLLAELKGAPRSLIYRLIRKGQVRVNGGRCKPHQKVQQSDQVRIPPVRLGERSPSPNFNPGQLADIEARISFRNDDYLLLDKPSGMPVHAGSGQSWGVIDILRSTREGEFLELGHRLDQETSGCLLLARNRPALLHFQDLLRDSKVDKRYLCLMQGQLPQQRIDVRAPLRKNVAKGGERMVIVDPDHGKQARTHFTVLESGRGWTFAEANIETGRTHQIRVHAAHVKHPLAGDRRYGDFDWNKTLKARGLKRLFLHCSQMSFLSPDGEETLLMHCGLAEDLGGLLNQLQGG
jgi:23S rRNA pseudouridine955/2504/2580 synthase